MVGQRLSAGAFFSWYFKPYRNLGSFMSKVAASYLGPVIMSVPNRTPSPPPMEEEPVGDPDWEDPTLPPPPKAGGNEQDDDNR
jgi:hypothetical protein